MVEGVRNQAAMRIAATGLTAQRLRMDVLAENIANASTTRTEEGGPYQRKVVVLRELGEDRPPAFAEALRASMGLAETNADHYPASRSQRIETENQGGVVVDAIERDRSEGPRIYDPTHPDADEQGYVQMPNVEIIQELLSLTSAARVYEANLAAMRTSVDAARDVPRRAPAVGVSGRTRGTSGRARRRPGGRRRPPGPRSPSPPGSGLHTPRPRTAAPGPRT